MLEFKKKATAEVAQANVKNDPKSIFLQRLTDEGFMNKMINGELVWRLPNSNLLYVKTYNKNFTVHLFTKEPYYIAKNVLYLDAIQTKETNLIKYLIENKDVTKKL